MSPSAPSPFGGRAGAPRRDAGEARRRLAARGALAAVLLLPPTTGCYTYAAAPRSGPTPGRAVELTINDAGRVGLASSLGPGVLRLAGTLAESSDSVYVLSVSRVDAIGGGEAAWTGDTVRVRRDYVADVAQRSLSRGRSAIAAAALVGLVLFVATLSINGIGGNGGGGTKLPPDPGGT